MPDKLTILQEIDAAIDAMDNAQIEAGLQALAELDTQPICAEDAKLFAARVHKLTKERPMMKKPLKTMRAAIVIGALLLTGLTAYAADALNLFSFQLGDKFVIFRSTEDMSEQEARELIGEDINAEPPQGALQAEAQDFSFDSVRQAEETLDMIIPLPAALPEMQLASANGSAYDYGDDLRKSTVWLNYGDERGRMFGVTVTRDVVSPEGSITGYTTTDIDPGSLGSYKNAAGLEFTTLSESDDTGSLTAHIATIMIGEYDYSLVFVGFSEAEEQAIIDSVDLSIYK